MWAQAVNGTPIDQSTTFPWAADASSRLFADELANMSRQMAHNTLQRKTP